MSPQHRPSYRTPPQNQTAPVVTESATAQDAEKPSSSNSEGGYALSRRRLVLIAVLLWGLMDTTIRIIRPIKLVTTMLNDPVMIVVYVLLLAGLLAVNESFTTYLARMRKKKPDLSEKQAKAWFAQKSEQIDAAASDNSSEITPLDQMPLGIIGKLDQIAIIDKNTQRWAEMRAQLLKGEQGYAEPRTITQTVLHNGRGTRVVPLSHHRDDKGRSNGGVFAVRKMGARYFERREVN